VTEERQILKALAFGVATAMVTPSLLSFYLRARVMGRDRALSGSTQALALVPGVLGQYLRRAFLARALVRCHHSATIEFGTIFSKAGAIIDEHVYVGPRCHLGLVHLERDVLLAAGVHVPSGARTHGTGDPNIPIREQEGALTMVRIGRGAWVGSAAVVMADVGANSIIGAGSVVTTTVPESVTAAGVPARVLRNRVSELQPAAVRQA
jgi:acetyltransferase-like isoleucine patch superfamily enzyme